MVKIADYIEVPGRLVDGRTRMLAAALMDGTIKQETITPKEALRRLMTADTRYGGSG